MISAGEGVFGSDGWGWVQERVCWICAGRGSVYISIGQQRAKASGSKERLSLTQVTAIAKA